MAGKELDMFEARELIRRLKMQQSGRNIAHELSISRETVRRYKTLAEQNGWLTADELPSVQEIQKAKAAIKEKQPVTHELSSVLPFESQVKKLLESPKMSATVIHQRLQERGYTGSYSSVIRFVRRYREQQDPEGFCRMEVAPRTRQTNPDHLPPDKVQLLMATPYGCLQRAEKIGPATLQWMQRLLENRVTDRLRSGLAALRLAEKYSPQRLEAACQRSLDFDDVYYGTLKRILVNELDQQPWKHLLPPPITEPIKPSKYARQPGYYFAGSTEVH